MARIGQRSMMSMLVVLALVLLGPAAVTAGTYASCAQCHALSLEQATGQMEYHGGPYNPWAPETACFFCHVQSEYPHNGPSSPPGYWNWPLNPYYPTGPSVTTQMCVVCHPATPPTTMHVVDKIPALPLPDHAMPPPTSVLPLRQGDGLPNQDPAIGGFVCSTCHDPHTPSYPLYSSDPLINGKPSFLRIGSAGNTGPLCTFCHGSVTSTPTIGEDLWIDSASTSVNLRQQPTYPPQLYDLEFVVRNRGNATSFATSIFIEAETEAGNRFPVAPGAVPALAPEQSALVMVPWSSSGWDGPVTFRFTLPPSPLLPDRLQRVVVRTFAGPATPANLRVTYANVGEVALQWDYNPTPGVSFNVFRNGVQVNTSSIMGLQYLDTGLAPETPHTYTVQAVSASSGLPSPMSNRVGAQTAVGQINLVPEQYPTIQAAIAAAYPGTSVHVAAGVYDESLNLYGKTQVTVKGIDANGCAIESAVPGIVDLDPNNGANTIAGFTIRNATLVLGYGDTAYGNVFPAPSPSAPPAPTVWGGGFVAQSLFEDDVSGAIRVPAGTHLTLANSIFLGPAPILVDGDPQTSVFLLNNDFAAGLPPQGFPGEGNISADPLFCGLTGFLSEYSPCRDAGTPLGALVPGAPDIGAFEYGVPQTPQPPANLAAVWEPTPGAITLTWDPSPGETCPSSPIEYWIYRNTTPDFPSSMLAQPLMTIPSGYPLWHDFSAPAGQTVYYQVRAFGGYDGTSTPLLSSPSNTASALAWPNRPPVAVDDTASTLEDLPVMVNVLANDFDPDGGQLWVQPGTPPAHGTLSFNGIDAFTYEPFTNYHGEDSFTYTVHDQTGATDSAVVTITITPVNDDPAAQNDSATTLSFTAVSIPVLANDSDVDGDALAISAVTQGASGSVTIVDDAVRYLPAGAFVGTDTFTYTLSDGHGGSAAAAVAVTVTAQAIRVGAITMGTVTSKGSTNATATPLLTLSATGAPLAGVLVSGHWTGLTNDTDSGTTGPDGTVTLASDRVKNASGTYTFVVDTAILAGFGLDTASSILFASIQYPTPPPEAGAMHVASITMSLSVGRKNTSAIATVAVVNEIGDPVPSATVSGTWSGVVSGDASGRTYTGGSATLTSPSTGNGSDKTFTFTVTDIVKTSWTYNAAANLETSDSITTP